MTEQWNCSVLAWGLPSDPRTFSGYSRQVTLGMAARNALRQEYSLKNLEPLDIFRGAFRMQCRGWRPALSVSRKWMWSRRGTELLQQRLHRAIEQRGDRGDFLQFGSWCEIPREFGRHFVELDMTIPQARRAGHFAVASLSSSELDEAIEIQRRVFHNAHHIFAATYWARTSVIEDFGIPPDRVSVLYTGPNMQLPSDLQVSRNPNQILFVGIDWERKGGPQLVEGFRLLRSRLPQAELVIVGCSPDIDCPGVRIEGYLHPGQPDQMRKLASLFLESSCFAMMSDFEPMGIVFIEAYRAGLPVVAFNSGSRSELVKDGKTGILCSDRTPQTIADALYRVLSDPVQRDAMSQQAMRLASTVFTWDKVVEKIGQVLSVPVNGQSAKLADTADAFAGSLRLEASPS